MWWVLKWIGAWAVMQLWLSSGERAGAVCFGLCSERSKTQIFESTIFALFATKCKPVSSVQISHHL